MATFVEILVAKYIFHSPSLGTKIVAAWSTAMFWEMFTHPCKCKLLLKLRLDVVLGDSSGSLPMFLNMLIWKSSTIQFNISGKISAQRFEMSPQWFFLSVNLRKFSLPVIYLKCIYEWQEDHPFNIQKIVFIDTTIRKLGQYFANTCEWI